MATPATRPFRLTGADGGPLRGDLRSGGGARPAVVICHGFKGFRGWGFFPPTAERLARAGFAAVSFNFSGSGVGESGDRFDELDRFARNTYSAELDDLAIVLRALRAGELGEVPPRVGLLGHSLGGAVAVLHTAGDPGIAALVTWAAVARLGGLWRPDQVAEWRRTGRLDVVNQRTGEILPLGTEMLDDLERNAARLDVARAAEAVRVPWLVVHGTDDESVPAEAARVLSSAAAGPTERLMVDATGHTFGAAHPWAGPGEAFQRVSDATVRWFGDHLA